MSKIRLKIRNTNNRIFCRIIPKGYNLALLGIRLYLIGYKFVDFRHRICIIGIKHLSLCRND